MPVLRDAAAVRGQALFQLRPSRGRRARARRARGLARRLGRDSREPTLIWDGFRQSPPTRSSRTDAGDRIVDGLATRSRRLRRAAPLNLRRSLLALARRTYTDHPAAGVLCSPICCRRATRYGFPTQIACCCYQLDVAAAARRRSRFATASSPRTCATRAMRHDRDSRSTTRRRAAAKPRTCARSSTAPTSSSARCCRADVEQVITQAGFSADARAELRANRRHVRSSFYQFSLCTRRRGANVIADSIALQRRDDGESRSCRATRPRPAARSRASDGAVRGARRRACSTASGLRAALQDFSPADRGRC